MKSIKTYLIPLVLIAFFSIKGLSQDTINKNNDEKEKISRTDSVLINEYFTEMDYNKKYKTIKQQKAIDSEIYYGDENDNEEVLKKEDNTRFLNKDTAEVIVEVVVNTLFIIVAIWH